MASSRFNAIRRHSERKLIGYTREQLFNVVVKVDDYQEFVPACKKSLILKRTPDLLVAKLEIGLPTVHESYISQVTFDKPNWVTAKSIDSRIFNHLDTRWKFILPKKPSLAHTHCLLDFHLEFEFKSLLYSKLAYLVFDEMVRLNVNAFLKRASKLYGPPSSVNNAIAQPST